MNDRARRIAAPTLAMLAALLLLLALIGGYASRAFLNADQFADRAAAALDEQAVSEEIGRRATDGLVGADPDLIAVRPVLEQVLGGVVGSGAFHAAFRAAAADAHRALFDRDENTVVFTVADIGATARGALQALDPKLAKKIPADADAGLLASEPPSFVVALTELRAAAVDPARDRGACPDRSGVWLTPDRRQVDSLSASR